MIFNSFKHQEFKTLSEVEQIINELSIYQVFIDNFDYKKAGLNESLVRDIQIILMGEISNTWKNNIIQDSEYPNSILNFISILSSRTLHLFENKQDASGLLAKDYVGINLLMAITLYNVTHS